MAPRVLLVEDNPDNTKLFTWILEDEALEVIHVESGEQALNIAEQEKFDLILMDIGLPGISGEETARELRKNTDCSAVPIIALTAHALTSEVEGIMEVGFDALITKPIDEDLFVSRILSILKMGVS